VTDSVGPEVLGVLVRDALAAADLPGREPAFERPKQREHGDWSTNVALTLAKPVGRPPREIAQTIVDALAEHPAVDAVEIAGPGFINFHLARVAFSAIVREAVHQGDAWGRTSVEQVERVNVEFVSANPTGPLHVGAGRWAAAGDAMANLLAATGWAVTREYYLNDAGNQIDLFGESVRARMRGEDPPENGYQGAYISELAEELSAGGVPDERRHRGRLPAHAAAHPVDAGALRRRLRRLVLRARAAPLRHGRRGHRRLHRARPRLRGRRGGLAAHDRLRRRQGPGAHPCRRPADVLRRRLRLHGLEDRRAASTGDLPARRRPPRLRQRLLAIAQAEGQPEGSVEIIIGQLVNLYRAGEAVRMSKRTGEMVMFDELIDEVGPDAARYTFLRTSLDVTRSTSTSPRS
jgi:arginyl-tRNA synthetase